MHLFESISAVLLVLISLEQGVAVAIFLAYCRRRRNIPPDISPPEKRRQAPENRPPATVVLAVRGVDPQLEACVDALLQQDYPRYQVRIVIDSRQDPAWEVVRQVVQRLDARHVEVAPLRNRHLTCSLKCSAVHQATEDLDEQTEVVATIDSDITPHATWLSELVAPLADPRVAAAHGNRWYMPRDNQWGSLVRHLWNVISVVNMYFQGVPWGGTLAVKTSVLRDSDLRSRWLKAGCEDVPLCQVLRKMGLKLKFAPLLMMPDYEDCDASSFVRFSSRQMLWVRLYHPRCWWTCTAVQTGFMLVQLLALVLIFLAAVELRFEAAGILLAAGLFNGGVSLAMLVALEREARRLIAPRGEVVAKNWLRIIAAIPLASVLSIAAILHSLFVRRIVWRGVSYEIRGPWKVRLVEYRPDVAGSFSAASPPDPFMPRAANLKATYPNLISRIFLKKPFQTQFIIPLEQPWLLVKFLEFYERSVLKPDLRDIPVDRPIFLLGIHRSGTTMVQDLLCAHPGLAYVNNVMPSFPTCFCAAEHLRKKLKLDFRGERMLDDSVEVEAGSPNEGVALWREWLDEDHHSLEHAPQKRRDLTKAQVDEIFQNLRKIIWCFEGNTHRFFCKNPRLIPFVELLAELFPDAKFIHLVRDARTCANSMVKLYHKEQQQLDRIRAMGRHGVFDDKPFVAFPRLPRLAEYVRKYGAPNIETTARLWSDAIDFINDRKSLLPSFHEVRYEDLLHQREEEIFRLLDFCELPPPAADQVRFWRKLKQVGVIHHQNRYENFARIEEICHSNLIKYNYI